MSNLSVVSQTKQISRFHSVKMSRKYVENGQSGGGAGIKFNRGLTPRFEKVNRSLALADLLNIYSTEITTDLCDKNAIHWENCIFTFQFGHHIDAFLGEYESHRNCRI